MKRPYENAVERAYSNIERGVGWEVWLAWPSSTSLRFERTALPRVLHGFFQVFFSYGVRRLQRVCVCVCAQFVVDIGRAFSQKVPFDPLSTVSLLPPLIY